MDYQSLIKQIESGDIALSYSSLSRFAKSPQHFIRYKVDEKVKTPSMIYGSLFHCLVLEPDNFNEKFYMINEENRPEKDKGMTSNKNKEWKAQIIESEKRQLVTIDQFETAKLQKTYLFENETIREILDKVTETEIKDEIEVMGFRIVRVKDAVLHGGIIDIKTTSDIMRFKNEIIRMNYHLQAGVYSYSDSIRFFNAVIDSDNYTALFEYDIDIIDAGIEYFEFLLKEFQRCIFSNAWDQGIEFYHGSKIIKATLPNWYKSIYDNE
jgi:hypothetical protein